MNCTSCNSDQTQKVQVIYEGGTSQIQTRSHTVGAGFGSSDNLVGGAITNTRGSSQTLLAEKCSPPRKMRFFWPVVILIVGLMAMRVSNPVGKLIAFGIVVLGGYWIYTANKYNSEQWPVLLNNWRNLWYCHKCGNTYSQS